MDAWYELVGSDDTTICLGDVSVDGSVQDHHQRWWREAFGAKWLVLGNQEDAWREPDSRKVETMESDQQRTTLGTGAGRDSEQDRIRHVAGERTEIRVVVEQSRWIWHDSNVVGSRLQDVGT